MRLGGRRVNLVGSPLERREKTPAEAVDRVITLFSCGSAFLNIKRIRLLDQQYQLAKGSFCLREHVDQVGFSFRSEIN